MCPPLARVDLGSGLPRSSVLESQLYHEQRAAKAGAHKLDGVALLSSSLSMVSLVLSVVLPPPTPHYAPAKELGLLLAHHAVYFMPPGSGRTERRTSNGLLLTLLGSPFFQVERKVTFLRI